MAQRVIAGVDGEVAGGLVTYRIAEAPHPIDDLPAPVRALEALENRAPGTQFVRVIATFEGFRRRGVARALLTEAERRAAGSRGLSLVVTDRNTAARRLYVAFGFVEAAEEPIVKEGWQNDSTAWILMVKPVALAKPGETG